MTRYNAEFPFAIAFPPGSMDNVLAEWLGKKGLKQCHVAETEKYAHVTFFFNGGVEKQFFGEEREMVPSPKVPTYDHQPEMNAQGVADKVAELVKDDKFDFVMCNFAPPDMVSESFYSRIFWFSDGNHLSDCMFHSCAILFDTFVIGRSYW